MRALVMAMAVWFAGILLLSSGWAADLAVVKCTIAVKKDPAQARGYSMHFESLTRKLVQSGISFDTLTDEQVIAGKLNSSKLAIFPFNQLTDAEEIRRILAFVQDGGKLVWFYTYPRALGPILGIEKYGYRGKSPEGQYFTMKFAGDRPPGFPAEVHQESPNCRIVEKVASDSRTIALWHDRDGKNTGIPAVILSPRSVYVAHVLWHNANADQQTHLVVAAIGHFFPEKWMELIEGALGKAAPEAGYADLDRLAQAVLHNPIARKWAEQALTQAKQARQSLASKNYGEALTLAGQARTAAQNAATALFPSRLYELRGAWVHPNDRTDWEALMSGLKAAHFNAAFPLMCGPESASYPSAYAPQTTRRDHMKECLDAARRHGIEVHVWKANWQVLNPATEQSRRFASDKRFVLSVDQAVGKPEKSSYQWSTRWLDPSEERNRQLEYDMLIELVQKYRPHGIHFDFMRYPESSYCYCDRCRTKFQEWARVKVAAWPQDCTGKGTGVEQFRHWRRHLQTSMVKQIAEGVRRIDPNVKISLAARASTTGSFDSDAQDWVTWSREGYLDFLCPMDYTDRLDVLHSRLQPQVAAINGTVPLYAGLGVSPTRSATPVNLSQQIRLARELGADGFLMFAWSPFSAAMLPALRLGAASTPATLAPHHKQLVKAIFEYPPALENAPPRTYRAGQAGKIPIVLAAQTIDLKRITASVFQLPAAGGVEETIAAPAQSEGQGLKLSVPLPWGSGVYVIVVRGEVTVDGKAQTPYYLRSLPVKMVTEEEARSLSQPKKPR